MQLLHVPRGRRAFSESRKRGSLLTVAYCVHSRGRWRRAAVVPGEEQPREREASGYARERPEEIFMPLEGDEAGDITQEEHIIGDAEFGADPRPEFRRRSFSLRVQAAVQRDRVSSGRDAEGLLIDGDFSHPPMIRITHGGRRAALVTQRPTFP